MAKAVIPCFDPYEPVKASTLQSRVSGTRGGHSTSCGVLDLPAAQLLRRFTCVILPQLNLDSTDASKANNFFEECRNCMGTY